LPAPPTGDQLLPNIRRLLVSVAPAVPTREVRDMWGEEKKGGRA